jgi:hypothetical protein
MSAFGPLRTSRLNASTALSVDMGQLEGFHSRPSQTAQVSRGVSEKDAAANGPNTFVISRPKHFHRTSVRKDRRRIYMRVTINGSKSKKNVAKLRSHITGHTKATAAITEHSAVLPNCHVEVWAKSGADN